LQFEVFKKFFIPVRLGIFFQLVHSFNDIENVAPLVELSGFGSSTVPYSKIKISPSFSTNGVTSILINHELRGFFPSNDFVFAVENGFTQLYEGGPRGSGGGELVGGRSIATDKKVYPAGGLAFVQLRKPILNSKNEIVRWEKTSQFVVDQDTGNAIRGEGRADFYFGIGDRAGAKAGQFHEWGDVFYIVKRVNQLEENS
jgi:hypothetical protein